MAVTSYYGQGYFPLTRWRYVRQLRDPSKTTEAFGELYSIYFKPVYHYIRRMKWSREDAEDLAQEFFEKCLTNALFEKSSPKKGKLRTLICIAVNRHVADEAKRRFAKKRGGHLPPKELAEIAEHFVSQSEIYHSPDDVFARECGRAMLAEVWEELREEFQAKDELAVFDAMSDFIAGPTAPCERTQIEAAASIGMKPKAFSNRLVRLRRRYRDLMTLRISRTVESQAEIDEELTHFQNLFCH